MAGMEEVMGQILQNPQAMQQIFSLAQSLNLGQGSSPPAAPAPTPPPAVPSVSGPPAGADTDGLFRSILSIASQPGPHGPQAALFAALKPFVGPERARQIDQALLVARIAQMATGALRRMSGPPGKGGSTHV